MIKMPAKGPDIFRSFPDRPTLGTGVAAGVLPGNVQGHGVSLMEARDFKVAEAGAKLHDLLADVPPGKRRNLIERAERKLKADRKGLVRDLANLGSNLKEHYRELDDLRSFEEATLELLRWQKDGLRLERPTGSIMHHLLDAMAEKRVRLLYKEAAGIQGDFGTGHLVGQGTHAFLVEHDWAGVFEKATDFSGDDFNLPYDSMCFEFRISGKNICAMITSNGERKLMVTFVDSKHGWVMPKYAYFQDGAGSWRPTISQFKPGDLDEYEPLRALICGQIRAACISLEAKATTTEIIRASHRLNRSREKRGRAPIADYHVIKLAHRYRALPRSDAGDGESWARKRLHFRRGHDRNYETYKVWIRWQLVGDPDLGFVDKHYRL